MRVILIVIILSLPILSGILSVATTVDPYSTRQVQMADQD